MKLHFFGAAGIVTGSCYMLEVGSKKALIDCGEFQDKKEITRLNYERFPFDPSKIDYLFLTHAHIDHCGRIPKLYSQGFRGKIYSTCATMDLCKIMLLDAAKLHEEETFEDNIRLKKNNLPLRKPMYTKEDVISVMKLFEATRYDGMKKIGPEFSIVFRDAGHILGSAIIEVYAKEKIQVQNEKINEQKEKIKEQKENIVQEKENSKEKDAIEKEVIKKIVFSGDLGQPDSPIVKDYEKISDADYVLIESTYGSRIHEDLDKRKSIFLKLLNHTYNNKGCLVIPSFALERTQELLYFLNEFSNNKILPAMNVYVDSPLAQKATDIFLQHTECYDESMMKLLAQDKDPFSFPELKYVHSKMESRNLNYKEGPFVVISGSGMCNGGRIKHHLKHHLSEKNATVLFVGFQAKGTLGRKIRDGESPVEIYGDIIDVNARVVSIGGFSSHADQSALLEWAFSFIDKRPKFFIVHGEYEESDALKAKLEHLGFKTRVPNLYESVDL